MEHNTSFSSPFCCCNWQLFSA